ncbi:MAG TPA: hypothetical protein PKL83_03780 [bacterium]|nr:hypothetical protein [bacterium]
MQTETIPSYGRSETYWRTQPPELIQDVHSGNTYSQYAVMPRAYAAPTRKILDLRPRTTRPHLPHLSPILETKSAANLWNSFKINETTSRLPFVEPADHQATAAIIATQERSLPLGKPHAIALGLALFLISLGILSFKL